MKPMTGRLDRWIHTARTTYSHHQLGTNGNTEYRVWPVDRSTRKTLVTRMHSGVGVWHGTADCSASFFRRFPASMSSVPGFRTLSTVGCFFFCCTFRNRWPRCFRTSHDFVSSVVEQSQDIIMKLYSEILNVRHVVEEIHSHL